MKVRTKELIGKSLRWAVGRCAGGEYRRPSVRSAAPFWTWPTTPPTYSMEPPDYLSDHNLAEPLIEDRGIATHKPNGKGWVARDCLFKHHVSGPTRVVAALRCLVLSEMGDVVDVPGEFLD